LVIAYVNDITDPKGYCKDITCLGRWENGNVEVAFENLNQLDDIMELIEQAFDKLEEL
tara:strand:- start:52 stop:225 length:174 start_codon:yes stop_codon:yes gene_type:complete